MSDLHISHQGDLEVDETGDFRAVDGTMEDLETLALCVKTFPGELSMHPEVGAGLASLIGSPMTEETISSGEDMIGDAAVSSGAFLSSEISVRGVPVNRSQVAFVVEVYRGVETTTLVIPFDFAAGMIESVPQYGEAVGDNPTRIL